MNGLAPRTWNGLAICAGVGGLEMGLALAIEGYKCVGYVEREAFSASVLVARMEDKALDKAPIWDDLKTFPSELYRGKVDIISAGFPCQPFSVAGKREGLEDERWLWPDIFSIIRKVGPGLVFLENVPGLLGEGLGPVLGDLAEAGYDSEVGCFSAAEVGASHKRERVFILAYSRGFRWRGRDHGNSRGSIRTLQVEGSSATVEDANGTGTRTRSRQIGRGVRSSDVRQENGCSSVDRTESTNSQMGNTQSVTNERKPSRVQERQPFPPGPSSHEEWSRYIGPKPTVRRGSDGLAFNVDRLRACGNGVVPLEAAYGFRTLAARGGLI